MSKDKKLSLTQSSTALLIVDVQDRLAPSIGGIDGIIKRNKALVRAAKRLDVPIVVTEQYPQGLGHTDSGLAAAVDGAAVYEKIHFNAAAEPAFCDIMEQTNRTDIVITGTEAHVCVLQTALGLAELGYNVWYCVDAVGSRNDQDKGVALERVKAAGISVVTTEMVIFEWLQRAASPEFTDLLPTIRDLAVAS